MKRSRTAFSLAVIGAGIAVAASHPAGAQPSGTDLHTTAKLTFAHTVDVGARGASAGDVTTFGGRLVGPDLKGRYQAVCVAISPTAQECSETLMTASGQIAAQASYGKGTAALTPITGGSGAYAGARGDMSEQELAHGREGRLVVHLVN